MMTATYVATTVGGLTLTIMATVGQVSVTTTTYQELSGYLDATLEQMKRDVWAAGEATTAPCGSLGASWLGLRQQTGVWQDGDVCYSLDRTAPQDVLFVREVRRNGVWNDPLSPRRILARHLLDSAVPLDPVVLINGSRVQVTITLRRTVLGRAYQRSVIQQTYCLQVPG